MASIENFSAGIISAASYTRLSEVSASDAENVRHEESEGALVVRPGYRRIPSGNEEIVAMFAHYTYVLAVTLSGELKWERETRLLNAEADENLFRSFIPARTGFSIINPTHFIAEENNVFVSNPNSQLKITFDEGEDPTHNAYPFYLPTVPTDIRVYTVEHADDGSFIRLQVVKTLPIEGGNDPRTYPIEAVGRTSYLSRSLRLRERIQGQTQTDEPERVAQNSQFDVEIVSVDSDTDADFIDIYQTESTAADENAPYYWIGRIPYAVGRYGRNGLFGAVDNTLRTLTDTELAAERTLIEPIAEPAWQLAEKTSERLYLNSGSDSRLWLSYYDTNDRWFRSITDYHDVSTGGFKLTGLKTIQQTLLALYTINRIFLLSTDPIAELHRVIEIITSRDDRDAAIGCIAPESLVDINGDHYFLSGNRQVYRFTSTSVQWESKNINPTLVKIPVDEAQKAVGFARDLTYCLCYPSTPESEENDAIVLYDTQRKIWWKDDLQVDSISKGRSQHEYGLINGFPVILNTGLIDNDTPIEWFWRGNKVDIPLNTLIHSVFLGIHPEDVDVDALRVSVTLKTEEGEQTQTLEGENALDFWNQFLGFNLRGRSVQVTLSGTGVTKIDRLEFNPKV